MSIKNNLLLALCLIVTSSLCGQVKISSPISILGFGEIADRDNMYLQNMGGLTASFHSENRLNVGNPASLAYLQTTVFNGGIIAKRTVINDGLAESTVWSGNLAYFSLAMPLQNQINAIFNRKDPKVKWGLNLHLSPYSAIGFNYNDVQYIDSGSGRDTIRRGYEGDGSTYIISLSNGWKYNNLSAGLTLGYLFGSKALDRTIDFPVSQTGGGFSYQTLESDETRYRSFVWNAGIMYDFVFSRIERADGSTGDPNKYLTLGLTYHSDWNYKTETDKFVLRYNPRILNQSNVDTLSAQHDISGGGKLPSTYNFGVSYVYKRSWQAGVNYQGSMWSNYENSKGERTQTTDDAFKISGGLAYTPNASSITSYLDRVTYSIGFNYGKDPRVLNDKQIENYGLKFGFSLPFVSQRQVSHLNLNFGIGKLGVPNGYKENYFSFGMGYSLSDNQWFIQRKYD